MFMRQIVYFILFATALTNAAVIPRVEDAATQALQIKKVNDSGLLDSLDKAHINDVLNGMNASTLLSKIVLTDQFKSLKTQADKKAQKQGKTIPSGVIPSVNSTGLLNKLRTVSGTNLTTKVNAMNAHDMVIKIAQSEAFKKMKYLQDFKKKAAKKSKKAKVKVIVQKNSDGTPQYTVITRVGGPAVTLAASGPQTVIQGTTYTIQPVPTASASSFILDSGASALAPPSFAMSATALAKLFVLVGGAVGGAILVL